jgi:hypothetical protein
VASDVHDLLVKTHAADVGKIAMIKSIVATSLDAGQMLAAAADVAAQDRRRA